MRPSNSEAPANLLVDFFSLLICDADSRGRGDTYTHASLDHVNTPISLDNITQNCRDCIAKTRPYCVRLLPSSTLIETIDYISSSEWLRFGPKSTTS
jgi:hypothetical protein